MTITEISQFVQSFSIIVASLAAVYGFDAWRREFIHKRRVELAELVLELFYKARDVIFEIRSPFGYAREGATRRADEDENPEHKNALDTAYVLIERYNKHSELFAQIRATRYRVMAQLGIKAVEPFDALNRLVNELLLSARQMARLSTAPNLSLGSEKAEQNHREQLLKVHAIYCWSGDDNDDPIAPRMDAIIADVETGCRHIIESKGTLFSFINLKIWRNG